MTFLSHNFNFLSRNYDSSFEVLFFLVEIGFHTLFISTLQHFKESKSRNQNCDLTLDKHTKQEGMSFTQMFNTFEHFNMNLKLLCKMNNLSK